MDGKGVEADAAEGVDQRIHRLGLAALEQCPVEGDGGAGAAFRPVDAKVGQ